MQSFVTCVAFLSSVIPITTVFAVKEIKQRIDCYPERESIYSNYSRDACLARHCLYDVDADDDTVPCYLSPNYGYLLADSVQERKNGLRLTLKRNPAVASMFEEPIENVFLDVHYYTNDIIRFKLYDADVQRYEVRRKQSRDST